MRTTMYEPDPDYEPVHDRPSYWGNHYEEISWPEAASVAEPVLLSLIDDMGDNGWAKASDITRVWSARDGSVEQLVSEYNKGNVNNKYIHSDLQITFPNYRLAILWTAEVTGQISDGAWENDLTDSQWQEFCGATIVVDTEADDVKYNREVPSLEYVDELTEYEGQPERMMFYVRASGVDEDYGKQDLISDLQTLEQLG